MTASKTAASNGDGPDDRFTWTSPSGVDVTLPSLRRVKSGTLRKLRSSGEIELIYGVLEEVASAEQLEATDRLDLDELSEMFAAWQTSGASLGEASRSST